MANSFVWGEELRSFEYLARLLQFGKLAFLVGEFVSHRGDSLFLPGDLFEDNLNGRFGHPRLAAGFLR